MLELSSREPKAVERNVRTLIQELIDSKVEPEEFCERLERLLNASPQPCLIGFLKVPLNYVCYGCRELYVHVSDNILEKFAFTQTISVIERISNRGYKATTC